MLRLTARAIRVGDTWVVQVPSRRVCVAITDLATIDVVVGAELARRTGRRKGIPVRIDVTAFVHLTDCSPAERLALGQLAAARAAGAR